MIDKVQINLKKIGIYNSMFKALQKPTYFTDHIFALVACPQRRPLIHYS